jgi:DNA-binding GntR family transcriptional regulator
MELLKESEQTTANWIYTEIRRSIVRGDARPGTRLSVDALSKQYGTSITPVREALQMLGQEGMVTSRPHSGFFVTDVSFKRLQDMLELRQLLEVAAVELAAARISEDQLAELEGVHAGYAGDDLDSNDRYTDENRRFHYLLAKGSGNEEIAETLVHLLDRLVRFLTRVRTGAEMESSHGRVIEALRDHDAARARQMLLDDLNRTRDATLDHVIRNQGQYWHLGAHAEPD